MQETLELLAPAGDFSTLKAVIRAGADAVYFGGGRFGARAFAKNFSQEELLEALDYGHMHGRKLYLAVNTLLKEHEVKEELYGYLLPLYEHGLDAAIVQDFGVLRFLRESFSGLPLHVSTQMSVANASGVKLLSEAGASRVVLARELSLEEISFIHQESPLELECFVHGALCYCYSGQCLFSSMLGGRSANRGRCAQPCRLPYEAQGGARPAQGGGGRQYPLSPKDLCAVDLIPKLAKNGVFSFKVEGRMKSEDYASGVVSIYRRCMDRYLSDGEEGFFVAPKERQRLLALGSRCGFTEGYYRKRNGPDMITFTKPCHEKGDLTEKEPLQESKRMISGVFRLQAGAPMELRVKGRLREAAVRPSLDVEAGAEAQGEPSDEVSAIAAGEAPEKARQHPVTKEKLLANLKKTGNTPFAFEEMEVILDDGLFVSMAAVNDVRRAALHALEERILAAYRREGARRKEAGRKAHMAPAPPREGVKNVREAFFCASVEKKEQIAPLLKSSLISRIYVDSSVFSRETAEEGLEEVWENCREAGKEAYYVLPAVFRKETSDWHRLLLRRRKADGFLAKSYDALSFLLQEGVRPGCIRLDHSLYAWSSESQAAFYELGVEGDTVPLELNKKEIKKRDNGRSEMCIYGYLPFMTSAQCLQKSLHGCSHSPGVLWLKDRYGVSFPVKNNCNECYNVIYNSKPLALFPMVDELTGLGVRQFRMSFTVESAHQVKQALNALKNRCPLDKTEHTYGHYKRGVE